MPTTTQRSVERRYKDAISQANKRNLLTMERLQNMVTAYKREGGDDPTGMYMHGLRIMLQGVHSWELYQAMTQYVSGEMHQSGAEMQQQILSEGCDPSADHRLKTIARVRDYAQSAASAIHSLRHTS